MRAFARADASAGALPPHPRDISGKKKTWAEAEWQLVRTRVTGWAGRRGWQASAAVAGR